ncbi:MAG: Snf7 family protein [Lentisphaeria bacterium]|nr:Snf7 family protein [Lentisphaeria bacterium]
MGWFDFLKSSKDIEREQQATVRSNERAVDKSVDKLSDRIDALEKEKSKLWQAAKMKAAQGLKQDAARLLQQYKAKEVMLARLSRQVSFIQTKQTDIQVAAEMTQAAKALEGMAKAANLDPNAMTDTMDTIEDTSSVVSDLNKTVDRVMLKDEEKQARMYEEQSAYIDGDDDLMAVLEAEVAGDMGYVAGSGNGVGSKTENNIRQKLDN